MGRDSSFGSARCWLVATLLLFSSLLAFAGCDVFAPFDLREGDVAQTDADQDADTSVDAEADADRYGDTDLQDGGDADLEDGGDADPDTDTDTEQDQDQDLDQETSPCSLPYEGELLAHYRFDRHVLDDVGDHDGVVNDSEGCFEYPPRGDGCDQSLAFRRDCTNAWVQIDNDDDWGRVRSIDFWFKSLDDDMGGIISRDASGVGPGDFAVFRFGNGRIGLRVQLRTGDPADWSGRTTIICSPDSFTDAGWVHVGVNIGAGQPSELWLDGRLQEGSGSVDASWTVACGANPDDIHDMTLNDLPWVIGAATWLADREVVTTTHHLHHARVDHLRFTDSRQDFSTFFPD